MPSLHHDAPDEPVDFTHPIVVDPAELYRLRTVEAAARAFLGTLGRLHYPDMDTVRKPTYISDNQIRLINELDRAIRRED
jgi:hypothetical protein